MTNKRIRLPKEGLIRPGGPEPGEHFTDGTSDVEGHGWVNPAPPVDFGKGTSGRGGELLPTDADEEGTDPFQR